MNSVLITKKTLINIPNDDRFNGVIDVVALYYDIKPILILSLNQDHDGPDLNMAIDYYAPAAIARMGMPFNQTRVIVKTPGLFDDNFVEVLLPSITRDPWGVLHAGKGHIQWREIPGHQYQHIMSAIGSKESNCIGMTGIFLNDDGILLHRKIERYNGQHYFNYAGKIIGQLLRCYQEKK